MSGDLLDIPFTLVGWTVFITQLFPFYRPGNGGREQLSYKLAGSPAGFEPRKTGVQVWVVTTGHLATLAQPTFLGLDPRLGPGLVGAGAH